MGSVRINTGAVYDQDTILIMNNSLEDAWGSLAPTDQAKTCKSALAERILRAAAHGERDPLRLRTYAVLHVAPPAINE